MPFYTLREFSLSYTHKILLPQQEIELFYDHIKIEIRSTDEKHGHDCGELKFTLCVQQTYNEMNFTQACFLFIVSRDKNRHSLIQLKLASNSQWHQIHSGEHRYRILGPVAAVAYFLPKLTN